MSNLRPSAFERPSSTGGRNVLLNIIHVGLVGLGIFISYQLLITHPAQPRGDNDRRESGFRSLVGSVVALQASCWCVCACLALRFSCSLLVQL
jgi:hypothetical protein